ncbi:MAG: hypothetical protein Q4G45_06455 [Actinomycetia bacterium]|nr:hypothetical protein [Actinomycetes bacterium]
MTRVRTGRGLWSQEIRLWAAPTGGQALVHRAPSFPPRMVAAGSLMRWGRWVFDLDRCETQAGRLSQGTVFLCGPGARPRVLQRDALAAAAWCPDGTRLATVSQAGRVQVFAATGEPLEQVKPGLVRSLIGSRGQEVDGGLEWTRSGLTLLTRHGQPPAALAYDQAGRGWSARQVSDLHQAARCDLVEVRSGSRAVLADGVAAVSYTAAADGSLSLLGAAGGPQQLEAFLEHDLVEYRLFHHEGHQTWSEEIGQLPRGSVVVTEDGTGHASVLYLEDCGTRTRLWDAVSGAEIMTVAGQIRSVAGDPRGPWAYLTRESVSTVYLNGHPTDLECPVRRISLLPGAPVPTVEAELAPHRETVLLKLSDAPVPPAGLRLVEQAEGWELVWPSAEVGRLSNRNHGGESRSAVRRQEVILPGGGHLQLTRAVVGGDGSPLVWIEPLAAESLAGSGEGETVEHLDLFPGSPEWNHSQDRPVGRLMLPMGWTENVTFQQLLATVHEHLAQAADWLAVHLGAPGLALGGHSFGASIAVLAATLELPTTCVIARSGAYDRNLTPLGFQFEARSAAEAPDIYAGLTLVGRPGQVRAPVLLVHGLADENLSTPPIGSRAMFEWLSGSGAQARLLELPGERHELVSRSTIRAVREEERSWLRHWQNKGERA